MEALDLVWLGGMAFLAGLIDSIAGGGGLIQLPALFLGLPDHRVPEILATNKLSSVFGTSAAAINYNRRVQVVLAVILPAALAAFVCSFLGARAATALDEQMLRPAILVLLIAVAIYTAVRKDFGAQEVAGPGLRRSQLYAGLIGGAIGFYDGFFGPGTGSFLMFLFIKVLGVNFIRASAMSKIVNVSTNLAALLAFGLNGYILFGVGLPMAACNVVGGIAGSRLAIARGSGFVRLLFLGVVTALILKLAYDMLMGT